MFYVIFRQTILSVLPNSWFKLEQGSGEYAKFFQLIMPSDGMALVSRTHREPYYIDHPVSEVYPDQHFTFLFKDLDFNVNIPASE